MSEPTRTPLRACYERLRALSLADQMRECVDMLENPEVLTHDLAEAYVLAEACLEPAEPEAPPEEDEDAAELVLGHFHPGRTVRVLAPEADRVLEHTFSCVTGSFHPLDPGAAEPDDGGLEYLGLLSEPGLSGAGPVLGAVESLADATPYAVLVRLLACLTELAPPAQRAWLDRALFKGALGPQPIFDLHLVLWQPSDGSDVGTAAEQATLFELTRDAAELAKAACCETPQLAAALGSIWCLRMDPEDFSGVLRLEWSV